METSSQTTPVTQVTTDPQCTCPLCGGVLYLACVGEMHCSQCGFSMCLQCDGGH